MSCPFTEDMLTVEKQTSRQADKGICITCIRFANSVYQGKPISLSTRPLVNQSTIEQVEYLRNQKSRNIYTQHTKRIKEHD